jgi:hypothetical protein
VRRDQGAKVAKSCGHILGVASLILLVFGEPTTVTLGVTVVLAPFTLTMALTMTISLACNVVSFALGDPRERAELLVCAIGAVQPPSAGEKYREAMLADIRDDLADGRILAIAANLVVTAPRTIVAAWASKAIACCQPGVPAPRQ